MKKTVGDFSTVITLEGDEPETICRLGQGEACCAFLVASADGFECIRMAYPTNSIIFSRLAAGTMNAKGQGRWAGCPWENKTDGK